MSVVTAWLPSFTEKSNLFLGNYLDFTSQAILLILFIVFNLLGLFLIRVGERLTYPGMKPTRLFRISLLQHHLIILSYLFDG